MSASAQPFVIVGIGEVLWDVYAGTERLGGAPANVAMQAARLGAEAWLVSAVGADDRGRTARAELREHGVRVDAVRETGHPTGRVDVKLDSEKRPAFTIAPDVAWDYIEWSDDLVKLAQRADAVCFGTLAQRSAISRATITRFVESTRPDALRVLDVNLRGAFYDGRLLRDSLAMASVLKLSESELPVLAQMVGVGGGEVVDTLREIARQFGLRLVALTRGPAGALMVSGFEVSDEPAPDIVVTDTVGAGDAFTASMVCDTLGGLALADVNARANDFAARVCSRTAVP